MKKKLLMFAAALAVSALPFLPAAEGKEKSGAELFAENCAACHPGGDNIVNPEFKLFKKDRDKHGVKNAADIIGKMRNPGPGMTKFDPSVLPDKDAKKIAEYILKTFK